MVVGSSLESGIESWISCIVFTTGFGQLVLFLSLPLVFVFSSIKQSRKALSVPSSNVFESLPGNLSFFETDFHIVVPDLIGFGYSDKPNIDYTIKFFSNYL